MTSSTLTRATLAKARAAYAAGEIPALDAIPCVCGGPRADHTGATHGGGCAATGCTRYREDRLAGMVARANAAREDGFEESMKAWDTMQRAGARKKAKGQVSVRPSDLRGCRKAVEYRERPPEDYVPIETDKRAAWMGGIIHDELARRRALLYPWRLYEAEVNVPGSDRPYRYDEFDPITATLYEIKTAGDWRFETTQQKGPDEKWLDQAMLYAYLLIQLGYEVETVVLLVLARENGEDEYLTFPYDEARALAALGWIARVATEIELGVEQPRDEAGPSTSKMCEKFCPARDHCWPTEQARALGRSPENLFWLGMTPDEEVVEEHVGSLVAARQHRLDAEAEEKKLKALVDGVKLRDYGAFTFQESRTKGTAWTKYRDMVTELWNDPERPMTAPAPETSTGSSVTWKRISQTELKRREKERQKALKEAEKAMAVPLEAEPSTPTTLTVVSERVTEPAEPLAIEPAREAS